MAKQQAQRLAEVQARLDAAERERGRLAVARRDAEEELRMAQSRAQTMEASLASLVSEQGRLGVVVSEQGQLEAVLISERAKLAAMRAERDDALVDVRKYFAEISLSSFLFVSSTLRFFPF